MSSYYDWGDTLSRDADVNIIIGARGVGKTYGLREQCIRDWKKDGSRFVEVCRYKDELADVSNGYFEKLELNGVAPELMFKTDKARAYVAKRPKGKDKPEWHTIGYFVALTQMQRSKKKTYVKVKRIIMDEAVLDRRDRFHRYLPSEYSLLANVVDSCTRENPNNEETVRPHVYLLGNACDLTNPYFIRYKIRRMPKFGKSWHDRKTCLLDYIDPGDYAEEKINDTLAGRMVRGTLDEAMIAYNEFAGKDDDTIGKKTKDAKHLFTLVYDKQRIAVWVSTAQGYYFVSRREPKGDAPVYSLTTRDNEANYITLKRCDNVMRTLVDAIYLGIVKFEDHDVKRACIDALAAFGLR